MKHLPDLLSLLSQCIHLMPSKTFALTLVASVVLAGACWWFCTNYAKLWNLKFQVTFFHKVLCTFAAVLTLVFTIVYVTLGWTQDVARNDINAWYADIQRNGNWSNETCGKLYYTIQKQGRENFTGFPPPTQRGCKVPLNFMESRVTAARLVGTGACEHFQARYPFLSRIVWADQNAPVRSVGSDIQHWFAANPNKEYQLNDGVKLAADTIRHDLEEQTPRVVHTARTIAVLAFLFVQAIPFTIIGWAAYRDLQTSV